MRILIDLKETEAPLIYPDVKNAYTKGPFYCMYLQDSTVVKFPVANIWRIIEDYISATTEKNK